MGLFSNRISREEVKPGDHIYSCLRLRPPRFSFTLMTLVYVNDRSYSFSSVPFLNMILYPNNAISLAGIYVGDGKVIHFTRVGGRETETGTFLDKMIVSSSPTNPPCLICGDRSSLGGVITSCIDCFLAGGNLYLYRYNVSWASFLAKPRGGTCTLAPSDPPEDVLYRANFLLLRNGFGDYDVTDNNCETFAVYCKTGLLVCKKNRLRMSGQVNSAGAAYLAALVLGFGGSPVAGYGVYCFGRLVSDIGMPSRRDVIKVPVESLSLVAMLSWDQNSARKGRRSVSFC